MLQKDHIPVLNMLRGLSCVVVCFYHFVCTTTGFIQSEVILNTFHYGHYSVSLFFMVSGIVIPISLIKGQYKLKNWGPFIVKRFFRIEPSYLCAVAIGFAYLYIRNFVPGTVAVDLTPTGLNVLLHVGYLIPFFTDQTWINPAFWTLAIEFQYYLVISILFPLALSGKLVFRILFYALFAAGPLYYLNSGFLTYWMPYLLFGICWSLYFKKLISLTEYIIVASILAGIITYLMGFINLGVAISTIVAVQFFTNFNSAIANFFGNISYSLYLLHCIVGAGFINFCTRFAHEPWQKFAVIMAGFGISVGCAWMLYNFVEKPSQKFSRRFF